MTPLTIDPSALPASKVYPALPGERSRWVERLRAPKNRLDPKVPYTFLWEEEAGPDGVPVPTATIFLTNRECPYRCLMCDLWRNTLDATVPPGAIAEQIRYALGKLPPTRQVKLYNAGSFFDPLAIPLGDYGEIADAVAGFDSVIVECHPRLVGERARQFQSWLTGRLTIALGLETVHPGVLDRLNKRFTVADFERAAAFLRQHDMGLRVFLLVRPPFLTEAEGVFWAEKSLETAFAAGADTCCLIPTRGGNGAMEALAGVGEYAPPTLSSLEQTQEYGLRLVQQRGRGQVFADLWDIESFFTCTCSPLRAARLEMMNRTQQAPPPIACPHCNPEENH